MNLIIRVTVILVFFLLAISCNEKTNIIKGYQDKISYFPNETINVYLHGKITNTENVKLLDINNNEIDQINTTIFPQDYSDTSNWWKDGFGYKKTFEYRNLNLKSGIYFFENSSPFIIKNPSLKNDVLIVYPSNTDNAYNKAGGRSLYTKPKANRVSFKRPLKSQNYVTSFLKWIPKQGFNVDYICDKDLDDFNNIKNYKVIIIPGHNEYWSRKARRNFDVFVNNGGHAIVLSGNTMWWQVRYNDTFDQLICYKKEREKEKTLPDSLKTSYWNDTLLNYSIKSSIGADFTCGGYGLKQDKGWDGYKIINYSPLFKETGISVGDIISLPSAEYDSSPLIFKNNTPIIDTNRMNFYKQKILGFDKASGGIEANGTFIVFQKTPKSGIIINTCSTDWCSDTGFEGKSKKEIKALTYNFIDFLLKGKSVF